MINIPIKVRPPEGHFLLEAINADTGERRFLTEFNNLIVNQGLDFIGAGGPNSTSSGQIFGCSVGTGTTPEAATDTVMQTWVASTSSFGGNNYSVGASPTYITTTTATFTFPVGAATGNLTEIGMVTYASGAGSLNASSPLFSHSLIKNGSGSPITITILSNESLVVTYSLNVYPITTPVTGTFSLNTDGTITTVSYSLASIFVGSTGAPFGRFPMQINNKPQLTGGIVNGGGAGPGASLYASNSLVVVTSSSLSGTGYGCSSSSASSGTYINGNYFNTFNITVAPTDGNVAGGSIGGIIIPVTLFPLQIVFSPLIAKSNLQQFSLNFNISWSN